MPPKKGRLGRADASTEKTAPVEKGASPSPSPADRSGANVDADEGKRCESLVRPPPSDAEGQQPPPPSPAPSPSESPRPGELEAIRSSSAKKKKKKRRSEGVSAPLATATAAATAAFSPLAGRTRAGRKRKSGSVDGAAAAAPAPAAAPETPAQAKKGKKIEDGGGGGGERSDDGDGRKKRRKPNKQPRRLVPLDARPALARALLPPSSRYDPRSPAPRWHPPPSPLSLVEEALYESPWRLLVACLLLNKTTAGVARPCAREFFKLFPDAESAARVAAEGDEPKKQKLEEIARVTKNCGLQNKRADAIVRLSRDFLEKDWEDPRELFGIGEYAADAYWIFCKGIWWCGGGGKKGSGERKKGDGGGDGDGDGGETDLPPLQPPRSFSWRPRDKDLRKYVEFLVETGGLGSGLEREVLDW